MKWLRSKKFNTTKKGMASFYIVIFTTILFGVVTLSFMRIILSESGQSTDDDLSRSAYDSAMAGVEDAKTAVNRYYDCLNQPGGTPTSCNYYTLFREDCDGVNGIGLADYLYENYDSGEVVIQQNGVGSQADNNSDQAYTCVILSDRVPDYRGTLTTDTRTKVIPIRINNDATGSNTEEQTVQRIRVRWYSSLNEGDKIEFKTHSNGKLYNYQERTVPPTVALSFIKVTNGRVTTQDFQKPSNSQTSGKLEYSTVVLVPAATGESVTTIDHNTLLAAGNIDTTNGTIPVTCSTISEFACAVDLGSLSIGPNDTAFIVLSLPYGDAITDFAVSLYDGSSDTSIDFVGVQVSVDSTGRTNQLVRRVESRLDPADLFFPYPQYEVELSGNDPDSLSKNFWITTNCWFNQPKTGQTGSYATGACTNNGDAPYTYGD